MAVETVERMRDEVADGLSQPQKELSPKYFYDHRGSELFEAITRLPEYYPTRSERRLLAEHMPDWVRARQPGSLVELGAGAADKTRAILDVMHEAADEPVFVPIDISAEFLERVAADLRNAYPAAAVRPLVADISRGFHLPDDLPRPVLFALLGGTIGNFPRNEGVGLLRRVRAEMGGSDRFLIGFDLQKDVDVLEAAYNDTAGVTAEFNLNVLRVLNRELGADFDLDAFEHRAVYVPDDERIEMHLVARRPSSVTIPGAGTFTFQPDETVRTEVSCKYTRPSIERMFQQADLAIEEFATEPPGFALVLARPVS
ncbi:MAG: L-histidine N(alpha)-methyltransferase [Longimicrobiales bacterium]|nr:L-histidine N(alpha)-methyltransferase [Longimicrobiales bacterium]